VRMDDKHSHLLAFALTVSCFFSIALPHSHLQPLPCAEQSYICSLSVSAIFDPPWEHIPASQCNGADASYLLSCYGSNEYQNFTVKDIDNTTHTMKLMLSPPVTDVCSPQFVDSNQNFNNTLHQYNVLVYNITIFVNCHGISNFPSKRNFTCDDFLYYFEEGTEEEMLNRYPQLDVCKGRLFVVAAAPLDRYNDSDDGAGVLEEALNDAFQVNYGIPDGCRRCSQSEGTCWPYDYDEHVVSCNYCPNEYCSPKRSKSSILALLIEILLRSYAYLALSSSIIFCNKKS